MPKIYVNGQIGDLTEARISVLDRSYLFGEGVFESLRSFEKKIPLLKEHLKRLEWSATFLHIYFPHDLDFEKIFSELLTANDLENARFKIMLSQYSKEQQCNFKHQADNPFESNLVIFCEPFNQTDYPKTYKLKTVRNVINESGALAAVKSTNYLAKVIGRNEATESGCHDGILLNHKGEVTETTSGNIFWIDEKK